MPYGIISRKKNICMEVRQVLGGGLSEVIYKNALEFEF